jgi:hypothetical protein
LIRRLDSRLCRQASPITYRLELKRDGSEDKAGLVEGVKTYEVANVGNLPTDESPGLDRRSGDEQVPGIGAQLAEAASQE